MSENNGEFGLQVVHIAWQMRVKFIVGKAPWSEEQKMNSDLKISSESMQADVPVTVFRLRGWLDAQSEEQLLVAARTAYDDGARYLLIDMSDLDTLTSAGMRALQRSTRSSRQKRTSSRWHI